MKDWKDYNVDGAKSRYPELKPVGYTRNFINSYTGEEINCVVIIYSGHKMNYQVVFNNIYLLGGATIFCDSDDDFIEKFKIIFPSLKEI